MKQGKIYRSSITTTYTLYVVTYSQTVKMKSQVKQGPEEELRWTF